MKIKIRAEGGSKIGFGHWSRCLFLASCAEADTQKQIFTFNANEFEQFFPGSRLEVIALREEEDFVETVSQDDIIIVDGYSFDHSYLESIKSRNPIVVYIDDLIYPSLQADIIINHSPGVKPSDYLSPTPAASFFLGSEYSLVPPSLNLTIPANSIRLATLLISMGGADPANFMSRILRDYRERIQAFNKIIVIVGNNHPALKELREYANSKSNVDLYISVSKNEVYDLMKMAGVAILSSSTMALEYAHIGGLLYLVRTADNQENLYHGLLDCGGALAVEDLNESNNLSDLYNEKVAVQRTRFDGLSPERFKKLFKELKLQGKIRLRRATPTDARLTFNWATDSSIRMFSFSQKEITWQEHEKWFARKIANNNTLYLIASVEKDPIGSIRFDIENREAIVSYLIDKDWQGQGLGRVLLAEGIKELQRTKLQSNMITGYVMRTNAASCRIFKRMGFQEVNSNDQYPNSIRFYKKME